jgi:hypothetical protein
MLQGDEKDMPQEQKAPPCAICGRPSGCAAWGHRLCYGETDGSRMGCVTKLWEVMPTENEKAFTDQWVKAQKKGRAA